MHYKTSKYYACLMGSRLSPGRLNGRYFEKHNNIVITQHYTSNKD